MQNFSVVRHRLRSQLNVQLTDSNVVQQKFQYQFYPQYQSRIKYLQNQSQYCDISLIDDLRLIDQFEDCMESSNVSGNNQMRQSIIINDNGNRSYRKHQIDNDNCNGNDKIDDMQQVLVNKLSPSAKNIRNRINLSLYDHHYQVQKINQQKHIQYQQPLQQQQQSEVKLSHIFKPTVIKQITQLRRLNSHQNTYPIQLQKSTSNISNIKRLNNSKYNNEQSMLLNSNSDIADIEQKISILPKELQQKIKLKLYKKRSNHHNQQLEQNNSLNQNNDFTNSNNRVLLNYQPIANQAVSFILPLKDDQEKDKDDNNDQNPNNNYKYRSKFISVNRQTNNHHNKLSNSANKKSHILSKKENHHHYEFRTKSNNQLITLNRQQSKRRTQKSLSRQNNILFNSISPSSQQSPSSQLRINHSRQKYQQSSSSIFNKNSTSQLIQRRRQQFAQFFKQKQQKNQQQNIQKQGQAKQLSNVEQKILHQQIQNNCNLLRQNHIELQQQFNKSKVIKNYVEILSTVPKCKKCSTTYGALTLTNNHYVIFSCNQCDLKNKLQRSVSFLSSSDCKSSQNDFFNLQKNSSQFNHPVIGVLFDLENKLENQQQMKTYNSLLKEINMEIQKIDQKRKRLTLLLNEIEQLKSKVQNNPKVIFEAKNELKKFLINNENQESKDLQSYLNISIPTFLPSQYLQQLDLWCKINSKKFTQYPQIDSKLQVLCPLYMKRYMKTMGQFINPLFHNFQTTSVKISVSQGLKLPVKSLGKATFVIDGPYNISPFEQIQNLKLEFINKRTFRQIASVMECLPQKVESIQLSYNHKLNSHISAQKYPILTKIVSIRSCKKLNAQILNCKDEDDLLSVFRVMTKKRQLKLQTTRSIYVRKPTTNCTQQIKEMLKRLGKNICQIDLKLSVYFNEPIIYKQLMATERNKLISFNLQSTVNESDSPTKVENDKQKFVKRDNLSNNFIEDLNKKRNDQNSAKKCFLNKIRKKLTAFVVLKKSFIEKEELQNFNEISAKSNQKIKREKEYKSNNLLRLQVLKMLI